jgi:hypothetical protein
VQPGVAEEEPRQPAAVLADAAAAAQPQGAAIPGEPEAVAMVEPDAAVAPPGEQVAGDVLVADALRVVASPVVAGATPAKADRDAAGAPRVAALPDGRRERAPPVVQQEAMAAQVARQPTERRAAALKMAHLVKASVAAHRPDARPDRTDGCGRQELAA